MPVSDTQGSKGLTLFYAEVSRDEDGRLKGIEVQRLKDKLGTRQMPTAELLLDGLQAHRVRFSHSKTLRSLPSALICCGVAIIDYEGCFFLHLFENKN